MLLLLLRIALAHKVLLSIWLVIQMLILRMAAKLTRILNILVLSIAVVILRG
jgi:hypothetical protein